MTIAWWHYTSPIVAPGPRPRVNFRARALQFAIESDRSIDQAVPTSSVASAVLVSLDRV
jgi:hypothetical protein